jgi:hypothetical protein
MDTQVMTASKHQWQSKPHRVRFFITAQGLEELFSATKVEKFRKVVDEFKRKEPGRYSWLESNDVKLDWMEDDHYLSYARRIIIIGDLIDGAREDESVKKNPASNEEMSYYPQVEIKLLRFINALNEQAMKEKGGIIKIIGNHDYENFKGNNDPIFDYRKL